MVRKSELSKDVARGAGAREQRERVWVERIEGWRSSGQTQVTYCATHGLSVWVLRKWIVNLGAGRGRTAKVKAGPIMLPIRLRAADTARLAAPASAPEATLEIALPNGTRIRAAGAGASELTRSIARALRC